MMWYSFEPYPLRHFSWVFFLPDVHRISPLGPCCGGEISAPWLWVRSGCQRLPRSCWGTLHWRRWGQQLWIQLRPWLETNVWRWKMREKIWKHEWLIYVDMVGSFNLFFNSYFHWFPWDEDHWCLEHWSSDDIRCFGSLRILTGGVAIHSCSVLTCPPRLKNTWRMEHQRHPNGALGTAQIT